MRFRAQKILNQNGPLKTAKEYLEKSIELLSEAGAKIELAHAQTLMARVYVIEKNIPAAEILLETAWKVFSKVNPDLMPQDLKPYLDRTSQNALWVESLLSVGDALGSIRTRKELLGQIIKQAMRIASADKGAIFLRRNHNLEMVVSRNFGNSDLPPDDFLDRMDSINQVFETGAELVKKAAFAESSKLNESNSAGWSGYFPIRLKSRVLGVIFIECGLIHPKLSDDEIALLRIISNQAAVAIDNLEAYEEIIDLNSYLEAETNFYPGKL
jgi:K+-sensing histidine kinase KdpD